MSKFLAHMSVGIGFLSDHSGIEGAQEAFARSSEAVLNELGCFSGLIEHVRFFRTCDSDHDATSVLVSLNRVACRCHMSSFFDCIPLVGRRCVENSIPLAAWSKELNAPCLRDLAK